MERTNWTDERLNESFDRLMNELAGFRADVRVEFVSVNCRLDGLEKRVADTNAQLTQARGEICGLRGEISGLRDGMASLYRGLLAFAAVIIGVLLAAQLAG